MKYCYIRKSTDKQSYERQFQVLKEKGYIDKINCEFREETYTGKSLKRPVFDKLLDELKENDTIIVESLSRFSRGGLYKTVELIKNLVEKRKINVIILKENLNLIAGKDMDATTKMFIGMLSILAEFERDLLSERTKEGLRATKKKLGRPTDNDISIENFKKTLYLQLNGVGVRESCRCTHYPLSTFIYHLNNYRKKYNIEEKKELMEVL